MTLGATASALRKVRGLSLSDIQSLTGINKGALSKFERGLEGLGQEKIDKLCVVFHTTPSVLYAVAKAVSKDPDILLDINKLDDTVRKLTKLIDNYLNTTDEIRDHIDKLFEIALTQHFAQPKKSGAEQKSDADVEKETKEESFLVDSD